MKKTVILSVFFYFCIYYHFKMFDKVLNEKIQGTALKKEFKSAGNKKMYIESYGCQMNFLIVKL